MYSRSRTPRYGSPDTWPLRSCCWCFSGGSKPLTLALAVARHPATRTSMKTVRKGSSSSSTRPCLPSRWSSATSGPGGWTPTCCGAIVVAWVSPRPASIWESVVRGGCRGGSRSAAGSVASWPSSSSASFGGARRH
jgi:hypothetical protein